MVMYQFRPKIQLSSKHAGPRQAGPLSPFPHAGLAPSGAVDRSSGCSSEPARLGLQPPGLHPCTSGPALLPAGVDPIWQGWESLGSVLGLLAAWPSKPLQG